MNAANLRGYLVSRVEKKYISRVLIFTNDRLRKNLRVLIFANLEFLLLIAYSRSLLVGLVQGGLEVPYEVTEMMRGSVVHHLLLTRYEKLLRELYIEPKNKKIVGTFLSVPDKEAKQAETKSRQQKEQQKKKEMRSRDIRVCCKTQEQKRMAPRKLLYLTSLCI